MRSITMGTRYIVEFETTEVQDLNTPAHENDKIGNLLQRWHKMGAIKEYRIERNNAQRTSTTEAV